MTAAGLHSAFQHDNVIPVYLNPKSNSLIDVQKKEKNVPCSMISLDDYAAAIGAKRIHTYDDTIADNKKTLIYSSAEKFMEDYETWNALSRYISKQYKEDVGYVTIPNTIREDKKSYTVSGMLKDLIQLNCLESAAPLKYRFKGEDAKHLIVKSGVLLEMYIYFKAKEVFGNALTSVEFDWDTSDNKCSVDNELDVIAMKKSRPIFISCKMRKLTREHIYEISAVARRFGNSNVIPLLATTYDFKNDHEILDRARFMKVGLIYAQDFNESNKTASEIFNTAINSVAG